MYINMLETVLLLFSLIPFYIIGTIPSGYLISRYHGVDIKTVGSGNVGATNVGRALGKKAALLTLSADITKGVIAVAFAKLLTDDPQFHAMTATAVVAGHCLSIPPWLKGGKGVATSLGALTVLSWTVASSAVAMFILVFAMWKIVSLASVTAAFTASLVMLFGNYSDAELYAIGILTLLVVFKHRANLKRLCEGKEKKFEFKQS